MTSTEDTTTPAGAPSPPRGARRAPIEDFERIAPRFPTFRTFHITTASTA